MSNIGVALYNIGHLEEVPFWGAGLLLKFAFLLWTFIRLTIGTVSGTKGIRTMLSNNMGIRQTFLL
jgi:hypothetical protein